MSYELKIDPKKRAAGRFIGSVRKALVEAAIEEKKRSGLSQQKVAGSLGVNRSVINRMLNGSANLTLRSVAEIAWALGLEPTFALRRRGRVVGDNREEPLVPAAGSGLMTSSGSAGYATISSAPSVVPTSSSFAGPTIVRTNHG